MPIIANVITFTMSDVLFAIGTICLVIITLYLVRTLKALYLFLVQATRLAEESSKIVEDVQEKSDQVTLFLQHLLQGSATLSKFLKK